MKKFIKNLKNNISKIFKRIKNSKRLKKVTAKTKEFMLHITDKEYLKENIRIVILGILALIFLVTIIVYLIISKNISKIEEEKINKETREYANYIEDIVDIKSKDLDKYIIYTLDYYDNVNGINELSSAEISEFLNNSLNKKVKEEEVLNFGVNPNMVEKNITFDASTNKYKLNEAKLDRQSIAKNEVIYYRQKKLRKINKNKYKITYEKYIIKDPYAVLDYFLERNRQDKGQEQKDGTMQYDIVDISEMKEYLITGEVSHLKHFLNQNEKEMKKFAKKSGKIKITYVINDHNEVKVYKVK